MINCSIQLIWTVIALKSVETYQFIYFSAKEFFHQKTNSEPAPNSTGDAEAVVPEPWEVCTPRFAKGYKAWPAGHTNLH